MIPTIIICVATCVLMILGVLLFPKIKLGKIRIDSYWLITLLGAITLILSGQTDIEILFGALTSNSAINPLKILVLFISMTILSIFLDEIGFFRFLANATLKKAKSGQKKLFLLLYITVSVLTVFTSNDIIILSFTPFICYFSKNADIDPTPYLTCEFVAANTWSMALIIGNPTNIYLATAYGVDFLEYAKIMLLPTLFAGATAFLATYLAFRKKLSKPLNCSEENFAIKDKLSLRIGLIHLAVCTVLLAISSYINLQMWLVALLSMLSLCVFSATISLARGEKPVALKGCVKRAPWQLIPFILSMFTLIVSLSDKGVTAYIGNALGNNLTILKYGASSFISANLINNIPMSVLFSSIIEATQSATALKAVFATVIGSNVGAFLTPIGALAGIMWGNIADDHGVKLKYLDFLNMGIKIAIPTLLSALLGLAIIL